MLRVFLFFDFERLCEHKERKKMNQNFSPESVAFIVALGTRVRSAALVNARITDHVGLTRPFQVYFGMYLFWKRGKSERWSFFSPKKMMMIMMTMEKKKKGNLLFPTHSGMCVW